MNFLQRNLKKSISFRIYIYIYIKVEITALPFVNWYQPYPVVLSCVEFSLCVYWPVSVLYSSACQKGTC